MKRLTLLRESLNKSKTKRRIINALTGKMRGSERITILMQIMEDNKDDMKDVGKMIDKLARKHLSNWSLEFFPKDFYKWYTTPD